MPSYALEQVPFSRRGAWWGVSRLPKARATELGKVPGLFVRTYRGNVPMAQREVLRVEFLPLRGNRKLKVVDQTAPGRVRFRRSGKPGAVAEVTFADAQTLRWQGRGCRLKLTAIASGYDTARPADHARWELNLFSARLQVMLTSLAGRATVHAPWAELRSECIEIIIAPNTPNGRWEIALQEFEGAWLAHRQNLTFHACAAKTAREYGAWLDTQAPCDRPLGRARALASYITWSALVAPSGHLRREGMLMSKNWMVNIWSWDHCFNALGLLPGQAALAWAQWAVMFDHQHASGVLPDTLNDRDRVWNFTKPPVHGWALREMLSRGFRPTQGQMQQAAGWLEKWTNWWLTHRDDDHDGLPQYNHGNDSGWDNASLFGAGPSVEGPDLATFLIIQMDVIADLRDRLGDRRVAVRWRRRADQLGRRLLAHSWDARRGRFTGPRSGDHKTAEGDSLVAFVPLLLGERLPQAVRQKLVDDLTTPGRFLTKHGLATESITSPLYRSRGYWRGPIWAPSTLLIVRGLEACHEPELARVISRRFCQTFSLSGSAENFDALTGAGLCDQAYTWTSSVFLVLAHDLSRPAKVRGPTRGDGTMGESSIGGKISFALERPGVALVETY